MRKWEVGKEDGGGENRIVLFGARAWSRGWRIDAHVREGEEIERAGEGDLREGGERLDGRREGERLDENLE